jgi:DNA adenine methylase
VRLADFEVSITSHMEEFLYCDPPYYLKEKSKLYGNSGDLHKEFDHEKLAELLTSRGGWILSYNNCPEIKEMYKGYDFLYPDWKYGMSKDKDSKEILIVNY